VAFLSPHPSQLFRWQFIFSFVIQYDGFIDGVTIAGPEESVAYFNELIKSFEHGNEHCDQSALSHLLWDLETTTNVSEHWTDDPRFSSRFVATTGGVSRIEIPS